MDKLIITAIVAPIVTAFLAMFGWIVKFLIGFVKQERLLSKEERESFQETIKEISDNSNVAIGLLREEVGQVLEWVPSSREDHLSLIKGQKCITSKIDELKKKILNQQ